MRNDLPKPDSDMKVGASKNDQKLILGMAEKGYNAEEISVKLRIKEQVVKNFMPKVPESKEEKEMPKSQYSKPKNKGKPKGK